MIEPGSITGSIMNQLYSRVGSSNWFDHELSHVARLDFKLIKMIKITKTIKNL